MKKITLAVITALGLFGLMAPASAEVKIPAVYVALGDSLAAGQTPNSQIDAGYAELIAQELSRQQPVAFFTKNLAFPGFTTGDVLDRVRSEEAQEVLQTANIITLSAGANDLLGLVQSNPAEGSIVFNQIQADYALNGARENMETILSELTDRAPGADVYVMGYYFPYPHARESQKPGVEKQLDRLNEILKRSAEEAGAVFVPVDGAFGNDATDKLPNPADVHPNILGYQAMANAFLAAYAPGWRVENYELPPSSPQSFEEIMAGQEAAESAEPADAAASGDAEQPAMDDSASKPSDEAVTDYLAMRGPMLYI